VTGLQNATGLHFTGIAIEVIETEIDPPVETEIVLHQIETVLPEGTEDLHVQKKNRSLQERRRQMTVVLALKIPLSVQLNRGVLPPHWERKKLFD